jgi:hypothetical protein
MKDILRNKVAVITGGSRGLGYAIAEAYAGLRWLLQRPIELMDLNISSIQPVQELAPAYVEEEIYSARRKNTHD